MTDVEIKYTDNKRRCGTCSLCCKLLPVKAVHKAGGVRCRHQRFGGCKVYDRLEMVSPECRLWNCAWLGGVAGAIGRPDHSHIVIDIMPDFVTLHQNDGRQLTMPAVQVWIDPKHREAHRNPALRAYLDQRGRDDGACAIIRFGPVEGFVLFPPSLTGAGWHEDHTPPNERSHSFAEIIEAAHQRLDAAGVP